MAQGAGPRVLQGTAALTPPFFRALPVAWSTRCSVSMPSGKTASSSPCRQRRAHSLTRKRQPGRRVRTALAHPNPLLPRLRSHDRPTCSLAMKHRASSPRAPGIRSGLAWRSRAGEPPAKAADDSTSARDREGTGDAENTMAAPTVGRLRASRVPGTLMATGTTRRGLHPPAAQARPRAVRRQQGTPVTRPGVGFRAHPPASAARSRRWRASREIPRRAQACSHTARREAQPQTHRARADRSAKRRTRGARRRHAPPPARSRCPRARGPTPR